MVFLEQSQTHFKSLGYCWYDKDQRLPKDGRAAKINAVISLFLIWVAIVSLEYFFDSENPRNDRMFVIIAFLGFLELDGAHFTFSNKKTKLYHFFEHFQSVITKRTIKNRDAIAFYTTAEQKAIAIRHYALIFTFSSYEPLLIVSTLYNIIVKIILERCQSDPATWYTLMNMNIPFDKHTLYGYFWYLSQNCIYVNLYLFLLTVITQFFVGTCAYLLAFCQDFASAFEKLDKLTSIDDRNIDKIQLKKQLRDIVRFHIDIFEYFDDLVDILNGFLLATMTSGALFFAVSMQQIDSGIAQFDLNLLNSLSAAVVCISVSLPFCYLSTSASENLKSIDRFVYNSLWYTFPATYQRYIQLLLVPSVHVREFSGYGFINCSLETFTKMLNTAASVYLMIKSL